MYVVSFTAKVSANVIKRIFIVGMIIAVLSYLLGGTTLTICSSGA